MLGVSHHPLGEILTFAQFVFGLLNIGPLCFPFVSDVTVLERFYYFVCVSPQVWFNASVHR